MEATNKIYIFYFYFIFIREINFKRMICPVFQFTIHCSAQPYQCRKTKVIKNRVYCYFSYVVHVLRMKMAY